MSFKLNFSKILNVIPILTLITLMNVFITSCVAGVVLIELVEKSNKYVAFGTSLLTAIIVYVWLLFNHKIRNYIQEQEIYNDQ